MTAIIGGLWALAAPWLGPVVAFLFPWWARLKGQASNAGSWLAPLAGVAIIVGAVVLGLWHLSSRREELREQGEAKCQKIVLSASVKTLAAKVRQAQRAEDAANSAREQVASLEEKSRGLEAEVAQLRSTQPPAAVKAKCYPKEIAKRLNQ